MDCRIALAVLLAATLSTQLAAPGRFARRVQPIY